MNQILRNVLLLMYIIHHMSIVSTTFIHLDLNEYQCFHEIISEKIIPRNTTLAVQDRNDQTDLVQMKMSIIYDVVNEEETGFYDINFYVFNTNNEIFYQQIQKSTGKFMFAINQPGKYEYCFDNNKRFVSQTPKDVKFHIQLIDSNPINPSDASNIFNSLSTFHEELNMIKYDVNVQEHQLIRHKNLSENINCLVLYWSIFEVILAISVFFGEVFYIKKFFEVRRII